ncbi:Ornithine carbamoyltransferase, mitochondrial, partial [Pseudocercospora fuligena]
SEVEQAWLWSHRQDWSSDCAHSHSALTFPMATSRLCRPAALRTLKNASVTPKRFASNAPSTSQPAQSPFAPRHLLSISDLLPSELTTLVRNASKYKTAVKSQSVPPHLQNRLMAQTIAIMFTKRSTRTRVSTEGAISMMGGNPMFLGSQDIQLGVNESLYDTSVVISSMVSAIVARVNAHDDVANLAKHSSKPVINALSDLYHPLQTIADFQTLLEAFPSSESAGAESLGLEGLKIAWVGDANNVLFDLAIGAAKLGVEVAVATPKGYEIPDFMRDIIKSTSPNFKLTETHEPAEAVKNADVLVTDTWVSMGQEAEAKKRLRDFEGFQITKELAQRGGAKEGWKFMHCLPRHPEEVADEVFYSPASLVFQEAENRLWAAVAALEAFAVNKGEVIPAEISEQIHAGQVKAMMEKLTGKSS